ncbi:MAG: L,D-transpeptidase family protein [Alphaproteobacteria bacterium]|nr:L,D-transpeptidase family protein [Alphaproteobacteria bacterium]
MRALIVAISLALFVVGPAAAKTTAIDLIVVDKSRRVMTLWAGKLPVKTYRIALGGNPVGHKEQEGDSRTPEGRYVIDGKNPNSTFHLSLRISYPNRKDRAAAAKRGVSPGGWIMIHGTPGYLSTFQNVGVLRDWTAGCIAVANDEIEEIFKQVRIGTPIVIKP